MIMEAQSYIEPTRFELYVPVVGSWRYVFRKTDARSYLDKGFTAKEVTLLDLERERICGLLAIRDVFAVGALVGLEKLISLI